MQEGLRDQSSRDDLDVEIVRAVAAEAPTRLVVLAQELATNGVDVIIAVSPLVRTAKDATGSIPIVAVDLELDPALLSSPVFGSSQQLVAELALKNQLPSLMLSTEFAEVGGLLAYGPNAQDLFRQAAAVTRKLLLGAKAADLPVKRPARFQLAINLKTAQVLSLTPLHNTLLARADEVIE